jgi:hypothetical protein
LDECRAMFGDDTQDYGTALERIMGMGRQRTGSKILSALMPQRTRGKTGPRPGHIICISWTRWRWRARLGFECGLG